jgi:hypothetical protein
MTAGCVRVFQAGEVCRAASLPGPLARDSSRRRWEPMNAGDDCGLNNDGGVPGVWVGPAVDARGGRAIWRRRRFSSVPPSAAQPDRAGPRPHAHANPRIASRPHAPLTPNAAAQAGAMTAASSYSSAAVASRRSNDADEAAGKNSVSRGECASCRENRAPVTPRRRDAAGPSAARPVRKVRFVSEQVIYGSASFG